MGVDICDQDMFLPGLMVCRDDDLDGMAVEGGWRRQERVRVSAQMLAWPFEPPEGQGKQVNR